MNIKIYNSWLGPLFIKYSIHFLVFVLLALNFQLSFLDILHRWDAGWYLRIIQSGYDSQSYAFFPLYPMIVGVFSTIFGFMHPAFIGSLLSAMFLCLFFSFGFFEPPSSQLDLKYPSFRQNKHYKTALWLFLFSPASYVFQTVHTEALFLFLTGAALYFYRRDRFFWTAIFCGLSSLTRIQGCLLTMALAFHVLMAGKRSEDSKNWANFFMISIISLVFFSSYLVYQYREVGDPFQFLKAHDQWAHESTSSPIVWLKSFFLLNPWQKISINSILHHVFYGLLLFLSIKLCKRGSVEGFYGILSLLIIPIQGEFVDVFRFGAVLFPLFFLLAEYLDSMLKLHLVKIFFVAWIAVNLAVTYAYCIGRWAY